VPDAPTSVAICRGATGEYAFETTVAKRVLTGVRASDLARQLDALPARPSLHECDGSRGPVSPTYQLVFRYPAGTPVEVKVATWCNPPIDNGSLQVEDATPIADVLDQLVPKR